MGIAQRKEVKASYSRISKVVTKDKQNDFRISISSSGPARVHLLEGLSAPSFAHGRFLSRGEDHSVHRRHLIANLSHLALPHKLNDRLNGWPCRYAKERFFGYFAKYPVKDSDGPLQSLNGAKDRVLRETLLHFGYLES